LDPILVPVYNGQSILKYNKISYSNFYYQPNIILKPFFSEKLNDQFSNVESGINHHTEYRIEKKYRVMAVKQVMIMLATIILHMNFHITPKILG
jgi:hypothetical protein